MASLAPERNIPAHWRGGIAHQFTSKSGGGVPAALYIIGKKLKIVNRRSLEKAEIMVIIHLEQSDFP